VRTFNTSSSLKITVLSAFVLAAFTFNAYAAGPSKTSTSTKTAQGNYVEFKVPSNLAIEQNIQYKFDDLQAAGFFTNAWDGNPAVATCKGNETTCAATKPASEPVSQRPPASASKVIDAVENNRCIWLNGGSLLGSSYTQSYDVPGTKWTYTWTYVVTPTTASIPPKTAWVQDRILGGSGVAEVDINTMIAGESVMVSSQFPAPGKFSFSLLDSNGVNRVQNLVYTLNGTNAAGTAVDTQTIAISDGDPSTIPPTPPGHQSQPGVDLLLKSYNAGVNGDAALLWPLPPQGGATETKMSTILNSDAATNNNDGGAGGLAMAVDIVQPVIVTVEPGDYTVNLTGKIKGNSSTADLSFSLVKKTHITYVSSGCGQ